MVGNFIKFVKILNLKEIPKKKNKFFEEPDPFIIESVFFNPLSKNLLWTYQNKR